MKHAIPLWIIFCLLGLVCLLTPGPLKAEQSIMCRYLQASGQDIRLEISIKKPTPASVIFIQYLPLGTKIQSSTPRMKKFNPKKGEAKWLLKKPQPGAMIMTMRLDRPVKKGEVTGEIRYKDPITGSMVTMRVTPP